MDYITIRIPGGQSRKRSYNRAAAQSGLSLAEWTSMALDRAANDDCKFLCDDCRSKLLLTVPSIPTLWHSGTDAWPVCSCGAPSLCAVIYKTDAPDSPEPWPQSARPELVAMALAAARKGAKE